MTFKPTRLLALLVFSSATLVTAPLLAQNAATVNGAAIPESRVNEMVKQITSQPNAPQDSAELRQKVKEDLITREVLVQTANKLGLAKNPDVKAQLEMAKQNILIRALMSDFVKNHPISDAEIKAEYDRVVKQAGDKEYHVRHILTPTADEAKAIIAKLKSGASFDELAKQSSKDPGSASNGGDLGWATPAAFVKPFSDAMVTLGKGQMTETPIQTQYGFHVIKVDDVRPVQIPELDAVKKQIIENLEQKKLIAYQEELRKKAVVK